MHALHRMGTITGRAPLARAQQCRGLRSVPKLGDRGGALPKNKPAFDLWRPLRPLSHTLNIHPPRRCRRIGRRALPPLVRDRPGLVSRGFSRGYSRTFPGDIPECMGSTCIPLLLGEPLHMMKHAALALDWSRVYPDDLVAFMLHRRGVKLASVTALMECEPALGRWGVAHLSRPLIADCARVGEGATSYQSDLRRLTGNHRLRDYRSITR